MSGTGRVVVDDEFLISGRRSGENSAEVMAVMIAATMQRRSLYRIPLLMAGVGSGPFSGHPTSMPKIIEFNTPKHSDPYRSSTVLAERKVKKAKVQKRKKKRGF